MSKLKIFFPTIAGVLVLLGLFFRFYHISDNQFLFYDEGMYIGYNRAFLNLVANNPPHNFQELGIILVLMFKTALSTPKALWFFLLNLRVFFFGPEAWVFARWVSALAGLATVVLLYFWSKRYFRSQSIGLLSAVVLLILPSHVFYSRLGMQEALSTLLFLGAIYLYTFDVKISWRFFLSVFLLLCVYLTNYRMIIAPIFIVFIECFNAFISMKSSPSKAKLAKGVNWKKVAIYFASFYGAVLIVGLLYGGINLEVNLAWMFHQAQDAGGKFNLINFISYPFYVFCLEGCFFACFFWGSVYLFKLREYQKLFAFGMVLLQMGMFSFAAEKGARYLCVVLPMMAAASAVVLDDAWRRFVPYRGWILTGAALAAAGMLWLSFNIAFARTDYETAIRSIDEHDPSAIIVTTQPTVESLFLDNEKRIIPCPKDVGSLVQLYSQGARYLVIDPQVYISWTANGRRFSPPLDEFLQITLDHVQPLQIYPHISNIYLSRLVLDHNEQILDSIQFLAAASDKGYGKLRVYDLGEVLKNLRFYYGGS